MILFVFVTFPPFFPLFFSSRLYLLLKTFGLFSVDEMSGSIGQAQRQHVLSSFRTGKTKVLVCSDQMARGMDVEGVTCVVNYEAPRQFRIYLHRAGRTARAGQKGVVYTLLAKEEVVRWYIYIVFVVLTYANVGGCRLFDLGEAGWE